jgi:ribosomal protein S18 acetylase RimI-like enzyme
MAAPANICVTQVEEFVSFRLAVPIRDATLDDMPALRAIFRSASLSNDGDVPNLVAHPEVLVYGDEWVRAGLVRVAEIDGHVRGFATAVPSDAGLELEDLFTDPAFMRRGIATALIHDIAFSGAANGIRRLEVTGNTHARAFYESAGFVIDGTAATELDYGLRMHLDLGTSP